jgi:hypothetical protein
MSGSSIPLNKLNSTENPLHKSNSRYSNQIAKITKKIKNDTVSDSVGAEASSGSTPFYSLQKAIRQKKEMAEEQNNSLMNELASKLNLFKATVLSKHSISSDSDDEKKKRSKNKKNRNSVFEKQETIELKQKKELEERVFWTKEKMEQIRNQLRTATSKINEKTKMDFDELYELITMRDQNAIL